MIAILSYCSTRAAITFELEVSVWQEELLAVRVVVAQAVEDLAYLAVLGGELLELARQLLVLTPELI